MNVILTDLNLDNHTSKYALLTKGNLTRSRGSLFIPLFIISLLIPVYFLLGPLRLSPYRAILVVLFIPLLISWVSGRMGKIRAADALIFGSALWSMLALIANHGIALALEPGGIRVIETFGAYLLARRYVTDMPSFLLMVKSLFWAVCILLPFAAYEAFTNHSVILDAFGRIMTAFPPSHMDQRFGLDRAQVVFEHPILYGTFCASAFGLAFYVIGFQKGFFSKSMRANLVGLAAFFSVSTGAITALATQIFLHLWNVCTTKFKGRWAILGWLFIAAYCVVDLLSNRTPFHVFVTYLTFNSASSYNRILIWNYGIDEVWRHPIFGVGLNDWVRAPWMSSSFDNFWLYIAVFYGMPAFLMFAGGVISILRQIGRADLKGDLLICCRYGLLISLGGLVVSGSTVHYWNAIYCWFIFLIGSGVWLIDAVDEAGNEVQDEINVKVPGSGLKTPIINDHAEI